MESGSVTLSCSLPRPARISRVAQPSRKWNTCSMLTVLAHLPGLGQRQRALVNEPANKGVDPTLNQIPTDGLHPALDRSIFSQLPTTAEYTIFTTKTVS